MSNYTSNSGTSWTNQQSKTLDDGRWYERYYSSTNPFGEADVYDETGKVLNTLKSQAGLDSYLNYLSENPDVKANSPDDFFNSEEFASYKDLSIELAQRAEDRDLRLMDNAAQRRNEEYKRNRNQAMGSYGIGSITGYNPSSLSSNRYDGRN